MVRFPVQCNTRTVTCRVTCGNARFGCATDGRDELILLQMTAKPLSATHTKRKIFVRTGRLYYGVNVRRTRCPFTHTHARARVNNFGLLFRVFYREAFYIFRQIIIRDAKYEFCS